VSSGLVSIYIGEALGLFSNISIDKNESTTQGSKEVG
jgi:hypothetical protein